MLVLLGFYSRKPGLTWEEFSDHWRNVHGPLLRDTPETARYLRRYVQHHIRPNPFFAGIAPLEFDGFSEVWFDDADARKEMQSLPIWSHVFVPDEYKFLDMSATRISVIDNPVVQIGDPVIIGGQAITFL